MSDTWHEIGCTNSWHEVWINQTDLEDRSDHCPSCGMRKDGAKTLAGLPIMYLLTGIIAKRQDTDTAPVFLRLQAFTFHDILFDDADGNTITIPITDLHNWIVEKIV